jgi:branched-chain amino acid transport system substrate-binding protein
MVKMSRSILIGVGVAIVAVVIAVVAVNYWYAGRALPPEIKIGFLVDLRDAVDQNAVKAAQLAVREINEKGGLLGRPVKLLIEDYKGEVPLAVSAYEKLVTKDQCVLVIIGKCAEFGLAVQERGAQLYKEYPHILMTQAATAEFTDRVLRDYEKYKFSMRVVYNTRDQIDFGIQFLKYVKEKLNIKKVALLYEDYVWTKIYRDGDPAWGYKPYREYLKDLGLEVVYEATIAPGEKMFLPIFEAIAKSGADWIEAYACAYIDTITMAKQWAASPARDITLHIGWGAPALPAYWNWTGGACLGVVVCSPNVPFELPPPYPSHKEFLEKLAKEGAAYTWMSLVYNSIKFFAAVVEKAGTVTDVEKLIKVAEQIEVPGTLGTIKLRNDHSAIFKYPPYQVIIWGQWQGPGKLVLVWPPELAQANIKSVRELRG